MNSPLDIAYLQGAARALREKTAFNPADAHRLLQAVKKRVVKLPEAVSSAGPQMVPSGRAADKMHKPFVSALAERGVDPAITRKWLQDSADAFVETGMVPPRLPNTSYIALPRKGDAYSHLRSKGMDTRAGEKMSPQARKHLNAMVAGHEQAEMAALKAPSSIMMPYGHLSPSVILKEHNMLVTSPKGIQDEIGHVFQNMRRGGGFNAGEAGEVLGASGGRIQYGKGPRLSRHAIKRLTEVMERKAPSPARGYDEMASMLKSGLL